MTDLWTHTKQTFNTKTATLRQGTPVGKTHTQFLPRAPESSAEVLAPQ